jgi:hypothetical protein
MGRHVRRPGRVRLLFLVVVCAILSVALIYVLAAKRQDAERHAAVAQANGIADPIVAICNGNTDAAKILQSARTPDGQSVCGAAAVVKSAPRNEQADAVTEDQVQALVQQELAKQRPPAPVAPTQAQIAAAVQAFIAANPSMFKAPAPTSAQIQAAVTSYLRAHPAPAPVPQVAPYVNPAYPLPDYAPMPGLGGYGQWMQPGWTGRNPRAAR